MGETHLVVDGSNIATEGRSLPSLQQLLDAVDAVSKEFSYGNVTVVVDASFGHRIDDDERPAYDEKVNKGEIITPPAGVIGRGDAFILEVADRADAVVLSNDSFQEFHGTYDWLFEEGRLLGAKYVPGVGWIFLNRSPVRGPTSRRAVSDAKRKRRGAKKAPKTKPSSKPSSKSSSRAKTPKKKSKPQKAAAEQDAGRKRGGKEPEPYNEPLPFIEFVAAHPVGTVIEAEVEQFSSHGAYVVCDGTRCYVSLKSISDPPPRSAREVLTLGETREFVVQAVDTPRRGIDLAVPGMESIDPEDLPGEQGADAPAETAPADAAPAEDAAPEPAAEPAAELAALSEVDERKLSVSQRRKLRAQRAAAAKAAEEAAKAAPESTEPEQASTKKQAAGKKAASKKRAAKKKAPAKKSPATSTTKRSTAKKAGKKKAAPAKKAAKKKAPARRAPAKKKAPAKKAPARSTAKKSTAKKAPAKKASAKKAAKKAAGKKSTAKRSTAKKAAKKKAAPAEQADQGS